MTTPTHHQIEPISEYEVERRSLADTLGQRRAEEKRLRARVRRDADIAAVSVVVVGVAAMWNTAGPEAFAGNAAAALRVMYWILYLLLLGALAATARTLAIVLRHRSLRDARTATSTASRALNAWNAAAHYQTIRNPAGSADPG